ncbi:MAG: beta-propeller domain-containing protein [Gammaproteobacteria bacterium]|nr:beta-propeller domain-containing protein [Gammaproteobacteria bacterium]
MIISRVLFGLAMLLLVACGSGNSKDISIIRTEGMLVPVGSAAEFEAALKQSLSVTRGETNALEDAVSAAMVAEGGFTTTYTQEQNVDEFDIVKYDGEHLYIAPMLSFDGCCFALSIAEQELIAALELLPPDTRAIRVVATEPETGGATEVATIELDSGDSVQGLYLTEGRLTAITTQQFFGHYGAPWLDIAPWADQTTGVLLYDTSDPTSPVLNWEMELEGVFVDSRRIDDTLYVINRHTPSVDGLIYRPTTIEEAEANRVMLESVILDDLLPHATINGQKTDLIDPTRCYVRRSDGEDDNLVVYPVITIITAIPIDNPDAFSSICYDEDAYGVYVSENAVYLSRYRYDSGVTGEAVDITELHKFALNGTSINYRGSGAIEGLLWNGGQSDFRSSEHNGYLRLVSTTWKSDGEDRVDHHLYVLREATDELALRVVAKLPNASQPEPIGKPNEQLYGVRFFADRAYAVTFEQIDPLYVIDLSNPEQPRITGELAVTGFSDFLHPVSQDLLLGLGQDESFAIKLELFDVSDLDNPTSLSSHSLGGRGSYSQASYDRHAFTYAVGDETDRFAIPADLYSGNSNSTWEESGLYLFEIRNKTTPALASLVNVGSLVVETSSNDRYWPSASRNRSVFHDDTIYFIRDQEIWSSFWGDPTVLQGPN